MYITTARILLSNYDVCLRRANARARRLNRVSIESQNVFAAQEDARHVFVHGGSGFVDAPGQVDLAPRRVHGDSTTGLETELLRLRRVENHDGARVFDVGAVRLIARRAV